jgi:transcriptional regulator with XRE-family HTH domain
VLVRGKLIVSPEGGKRGAARQTLRIIAPGVTNDGPEAVNIVNLSATGMLIESTASLSIGQSLRVELPHAGTSSATVVWSSGNFIGCRFQKPLSSAALSAALLKSEPARLPIADNESVDGRELPFSIQLRRLRELQRLSLEEVAQQLGVSRQSVWYWEKGRNLPSRDNLIQLAQILRVGEQELSPDLTNNTVSQRLDLAAMIEVSKAEIAERAGTTKDKVHITIEF